jgi:CheY-like chemotaxis protein
MVFLLNKLQLTLNPQNYILGEPMGIRILVVDDVPTITLIVSEYLMEQGYETITAENGKEALELMEVSPVSLVISDIMMPKMGGLEFVDKCRSLYPKVPIIVVSAKNDSYTRNLVIELGANGFLEKPINLEILSKLVTSTLSSQMKKSKNLALTSDTTQSPRVPFFCEVQFQGENISGVTVTNSISRTGCDLEIHTTFPIGSILNLKMKLYPGHIVNVSGTVCYSIAKSSVGLQFLELEEESKELIDKIVKVISKLELFDLEYHNNTGKLIDTFVDKFDKVSSKENKS